MSLQDAMSPENLLCYEMNGAPLPADHGAPVRLIAPDWYGVANVKWLTRIEVTDTRYQGRFMARDYVSIREEERAGETVWTFTSVTHERLKSAPAKVTRAGDRLHGPGRGLGRTHREGRGAGRRRAVAGHHPGPPPAPTTNVTSRRGASGPWTGGRPPPVSTRSRSRAYDKDGNVQPTPQDPSITSRRTFWENNGTDHPASAHPLNAASPPQKAGPLV